LPETIDPEDHDMNYFVPNFGEDGDITAKKKILADTE